MVHKYKVLKRRNTLKKIVKIVLVLISILLLISIFIFAPLNRDHYKDSAHYQQMKKELDSIPSHQISKGVLTAGWAKINIVPRVPVSIASYGLRDDFDGVHDSIWCRAFVFDNGISKSALVTVDLLIFPPVVVRKLKDKLPLIGLSLENTFLSASHTHNGAGAWAEGLGGRFLAGKYNEEYVDQLTEAVVTAIKNASENMQSASLGFAKYEARKYIFNRLSKEKKDVDHWLRVIKIQKKSGETAVLVTYAAHPNVLNSSINYISGDYAGALVDSLEQTKEIDFAAFSAGAVGGHRCKMDKVKDYKFIGNISSYLSEKITDNFNAINLEDTIKLKSMLVPVYLGESQLKISKHLRIRPWLFDLLLQKQDVYLSAMQLGDIVLVGTPCDFSGELVKEFSADESHKNLDLVITSFNGGYIGYIIPDKHFDNVSRREAREMNWYGPYSGTYFTEIIKSILHKI